MFLMRLMYHSGSTVKSGLMQLLQESASGSGLVVSKQKEKKQKIFASFVFADVIKYTDILLIASKLQQFFLFASCSND